MKAIIVAAGRGSRMDHLTNNRPKCFLEFNHKKLIDWQIKALHENNISNISIVRGYMASAFDSLDYNLDFVINERWYETNMLYSLMCARSILESESDVLISYSDIIYQPNIVKTILETHGDIVISVDKNWHRLWSLRNDNPLDDAESLKLSDDFQILDIGQKVENIGEIQAQYMGLILLRKKGIAQLIDFYDSTTNESNWLDGRSLDNAYMTDILQGLILSGVQIQAAPIHSGWLEFDTVDDVNIYNKLVQTGDIRKYINI